MTLQVDALAAAIAQIATELAAQARRGALPPASTCVGALSQTTGVFDADVLALVLGASGVDALVVDRGRLVGDGALGIAHPQATLERGASIVVRRADLHDARFRAMAQACGRALAGEPHVQLFATPASGRSFGWHYDLEDVLILQTGGEKDYWFRENTVGVAKREAMDFARIRDERSPTYGTTLVAGDALFLPRGTWHVATARTTSWSVSIGVAR